MCDSDNKLHQRVHKAHPCFFHSSLSLTVPLSSPTLLHTVYLIMTHKKSTQTSETSSDTHTPQTIQNMHLPEHKACPLAIA